LIALLHRLGMEHRKPKAISRKLDPAKQGAFIKGYDSCIGTAAKLGVKRRPPLAAVLNANESQPVEAGGQVSGLGPVCG
jgi:hypothetical protein